jgi:hypothetical protein
MIRRRKKRQNANLRNRPGCPGSTIFRNNAAKILNPEQIKKLEAIQAERRAKLTAH